MYSGFDLNGRRKRETTTFTPPKELSPKKKEKVVIDFKNMQRSDVDPSLLTVPQRCEYYLPSVTQSRFWMFVIIITVAFIGVGFAYQLNIPFTLLETVIAFFVSQKAILHFCEAKYEEQKVEDVGTYLEQMLYSFRRNSKILLSLEDTKTVFPDGQKAYGESRR